MEWPKAKERFPQIWKLESQGKSSDRLYRDGEEATAWCLQRGTLVEVWDVEPLGTGVDTNTNWGEIGKTTYSCMWLAVAHSL